MDTTHSRAAGEAMPTGTEVHSRVSRVEYTIADAESMAQILSFMVEELIDNRVTINGVESYVLSTDEADMITWAAYHSEKLMKAVRPDWQEACSLAFKRRGAE